MVQSQPLTPVRVTSDTQAADYFGAGSMLHGMFQALFANDRTTEKWAIALDDDSSAVAASGSIKFTGTQTKDGTIFLYIGGRRLTIGASTADALDDIATKVNTAINANSNLQVTSVINGTDYDQVDITAKNKGEAGNFIDIRVNYRIGEETPEGLSPSITTMSGGTSNPDLSSAIAAMGEEQFNIIAQPYTDTNSLDDIGVELLDRWGPMRQNDGVSISASAKSFTDVATLGSSRNSFLSSIISSYKSPTPPHEWAAALSGIVAFHGAIDQARPFQTLAVNWVLPPEPQDRLTNEERNLLLYDGISTQKTASGQVIVDRLITNYQKNALGAEDISYLNLNTVLNLS